MSEAKRFRNGCVASPHYLASSVGANVLASGGNALDAAVATNLTLGVVAPYMCGFGGDFFAIVWTPPQRRGGVTGGLHAYNGSGRAPAAATVEAVRGAAGSDKMPARGPLTVTVPGAVEAWFTMLDRFGTRTFAELVQPALAYARDGFPLTFAGARPIELSAQVYTDSWSKGWRAVYADARPGQMFRQPDLARTIRTIVDGGPDAYYRGPIADAIASIIQEHGGLMSADDLTAHHGDDVETLTTTYRDVEIHQVPPNSQGVAALEALNIVEELDLDAPESVRRHHVLIEAMKIALADRDEYVSDPEYMRIDPSMLASKSWAAERRHDVDVDRASTPSAGRAAVGGTIYLCAADRDGMLVSLIQSNFSGFGSGMTVPGWGINLQNRGAYFSLDPDHVNATAPRKRTMHTLMPAMCFRDEKPWLVFGTEGGDGQPQTHMQVLSRIIDDSLDVQEAIDAPRWAVSPADWTLNIESRFHHDVLMDLNGRGHTMNEVGPYRLSRAHAIEVTPAGYAGATDPRAEGAVIGH